MADTAPLFDPALFRDDAIAPETLVFNENLRKMPPMPLPKLGQPRPAARGLGPGPRSPRAKVVNIDGPAGKLGLRVIAPDNPRGAYLHFHGGGLVMGSADQDDAMLARIADATGLASVSVEYRLAPEHPYPAAWDDCEAAAVWLARNVQSEFGGDALAIGGESAGATLAVPTLVRMRDKHGFTGFGAANLSYGNYDTTMTPSQRITGKNRLLIGAEDIQQCSNAYAPDVGKRGDPDISALYADVHAMPAALFSVGTLDPFLDDSMFLYARWIAAGNEAELAIYPGGSHGFNMFPIPIAAEANARIDAFLERHASGRTK